MTPSDSIIRQLQAAVIGFMIVAGVFTAAYADTPGDQIPAWAIVGLMLSAFSGAIPAVNHLRAERRERAEMRRRCGLDRY